MASADPLGSISARGVRRLNKNDYMAFLCNNVIRIMQSLVESTLLIYHTHTKHMYNVVCSP